MILSESELKEYPVLLEIRNSERKLKRTNKNVRLNLQLGSKDINYN